MLSVKNHWEKVCNTKAPDQLSWYRPRLKTPLALIERVAGDRCASLIDVGGGESTLVDDLLARRYQNITILDVSQTAMDMTKKRLGLVAEQIHLRVAEITGAQFEPRACDLWKGTAVSVLLLRDRMNQLTKLAP